MLQYNPSHCTPIAIQSVGLQYNSSHCTLLQYTLLCCNTILATTHSCNTILPYCNTLTQPTCKPHCNTIPYIAIQFSSPTSLVAIQILVLQYNYLANKPPLAIQLQYKFCFVFFFQPSLLQYNCKVAIQFFFFTRQLGNSPIPFCIFFFSFLLAIGRH